MKLVDRKKDNGETSRVRKVVFEPEDDEFIIKNVEAGVSQKEIAKHFAKWCSLSLVRTRIKKICPTELIKRVFEPPSPQRTTCYGKSSWSRKDDEILTELYPNLSNDEIAIRLGRTSRQVLRRARVLQLKKSNEYIAAMGSKNREGGRIIPRMAKNLNSLCIGRFCAKRTECLYYQNYLEESKHRKIDAECTLNHGHTTRCIGELGTYSNFQQIEEE